MNSIIQSEPSQPMLSRKARRNLKRDNGATSYFENDNNNNNVKSQKSSTSLINSRSSIKKKKLLIFDLNKVLVCRVKLSSYFEIRPYAIEFLNGMSEFYELAIWTSMKSRSCKKMIFSLFGKDKIQQKVTIQNIKNQLYVSKDLPSENTQSISYAKLLFKWYQPKCTRIPIAKETFDDIDIINDSDSDCGSEDNIDKDKNKSGGMSINTGISNEMSIDRGLYGNKECIYSKDLRDVWEKYPYYNEFNTILIDDSPEKCTSNPPYTVIHPFPYSLENKLYDMELKPGEALWNYLKDIADEEFSLDPQEIPPSQSSSTSMQSFDTFYNSNTYDATVNHVTSTSCINRPKYVSPMTQYISNTSGLLQS